MIHTNVGNVYQAEVERSTCKLKLGTSTPSTTVETDKYGSSVHDVLQCAAYDDPSSRHVENDHAAVCSIR